VEDEDEEKEHHQGGTQIVMVSSWCPCPMTVLLSYSFTIPFTLLNDMSRARTACFMYEILIH
jgi:hypothetical protein